jgi:hypothetical protein
MPPAPGAVGPRVPGVDAEHEPVPLWGPGRAETLRARDLVQVAPVRVDDPELRLGAADGGEGEPRPVGRHQRDHREDGEQNRASQQAG